MKTTQLKKALAINITMLGFLAGSLPVRADFNLGAANQFAVIYDGSNQLQINNPPHQPVTGNIGINGSGQLAPSGNINIPGNVEFSATVPNPSTPPGGATYGGTYTGNNANVSSAVSTLTTLSTTYTGDAASATQVNINGNTSISASSGALLNGANVFSVTGLNLGNGSTLTISGTSSQYVVLDFGSALGGLHFSGAIKLTGGITSDQVLFNIDGDTLQTAANGATQAGTFLDDGGTINVNSYTLDGRLFGIDQGNQNMIITSGADIVAPAPVPEANTIIAGALLLLPLGASALRIMRRKPTT